jgi:very-short-patch-repair endonuclease
MRVDVYQVLTEQLNEISLAIATVHLNDLTEQVVLKKLRSLQRDEHTLRKLPKLRKMHRKLLTVGFGPLLHEFRHKSISDPDDAVRYFDWAWLNSVRRELCNEYSSIGQFQAERHERLVARFNDLDHQYMVLAVQRVRRLVAERLVNMMNDHKGQTATLRREAAKTRRQMGLRNLVAQAPDVLLAARPCWALSPLVVSQVLPAQQLFDVVIFDEASQIRPADAITSIIRGKQVVVTGDERQLPPTTFFDKILRGEDEDDGSEEIQTTGMESVLAAVTGIVPPHGVKQLRWHYRSEDERLITFSNRKIYKPHGEELITFPGTSLDNAIQHVFVDALAPAHTTDSSTAEIDRVITEIRDHVHTCPEESLGVIALNIVHAQRLQAAVDRAAIGDPDLAAYIARFSEDHGREFFVKHLEVVQGDERDVIIFSLGYARDPDGRLKARFGALNLLGGERRLNVAVTRASRRLTVISSFGPEHFNPDSFAHDGAKLLWAFLHYAKRGGELPDVDDGSIDEDNHFENQVAEFLSESGVPFRRQVGAGRYRIDFVLMHPDRPGQRLVAVETDGDSYHGAASVRDRDRLRQTHLERLGWQFHRIWSSAWFTRPAEEKVKLITVWKNAVEAVHKPRNTRVSASMANRPSSAERPQRTGTRPHFTPKQPSQHYSRNLLAQLVLWITSDGLLRTDEEIIQEAARGQIGYSRVSSQIRSALELAIQDARRIRPI